MDRNLVATYLIIPGLVIFSVLVLISSRFAQTPALAQSDDTPGTLAVVDGNGKRKAVCPLKQTKVNAQISGFLSRVTVTQEFENPFKDRIEAVYTFPLPQNAAVDDMTMNVGERTIKGKILPREEAQAVYDAAKASGQTASLLDQERPNIFTQSVANILPGEQIKITISYVETLKYEAGAYEFVFPMVVGPRYMPGTPTGARQGSGASSDTTEVPDASRISPKFVERGMRSGHDVSLDIQLDAGVILTGVDSKSHELNVERNGDAHSAHVRLKDNATIPNKDFVLRYEVAGKKIEDAVLTHRSEKGGFFTMILQPPDRVAPEDVTPKELVFVLDTSGSMNGFPIEKAKETMKLALDSLYPSDTFNLITFAGDTSILFPEPVPATRQNLQKAQAFLASRSGSGGTEMMKAIRAALEPSDKQDHMRIVCFMTDGYVGNDMEIISEIQKHANARVFAFGIGGSVNRFLLDKMAENGRGEVEYVALNDDGSAAARRFHERIRNPLLTDISIDWGGLPVADVYPQRIPDLFSAKPLVLNGRFTAPANGTIRLKGKIAGNDFVREIPVNLPETMAANDVLSSLWARQRIENLMSQDYQGAQNGSMRPDLKETVTQLGLEYRLMTQFTSFVAVEEMIVTDGGAPRKVDVPIEVPEGVNRDFVDGEEMKSISMGYANTLSIGRRGIVGGGVAGGSLKRMRSAQAPPMPTPVVTNRPSGTLGAPTIAMEVDAADNVAAPSKTHPAIAGLIERVRNKRLSFDPTEARFVKDGKADIQIWLTDKSTANLDQLKQLGFEVVLDPKSSKLLIGRISVEKLEALSKLEFVRYISPQSLK